MAAQRTKVGRLCVCLTFSACVCTQIGKKVIFFSCFIFLMFLHCTASLSLASFGTSAAQITVSEGEGTDNQICRPEAYEVTY